LKIFFVLDERLIEPLCVRVERGNSWFSEVLECFSKCDFSKKKLIQFRKFPW
jgi:hypothetical protein